MGLMSADKRQAILVKRQSKVRTDSRGRSVWADPVESADLELVSTLALQRILTSDDDQAKKSIAEVAESVDDGVLARDPDNGEFEIINDEDLQSILDNNSGLPALHRPSEMTLEPLRAQDQEAAEELSLVSTQALRKVLGAPGPDAEAKEAAESFTPAQGFDPYNSG